MNIEKALIEQYGPLMNFKQLAELLDRSVQGLRVSLNQNTGIGPDLKCLKIKLGRRVYFSTADIANYLNDSK